MTRLNTPALLNMYHISQTPVLLPDSSKQPELLLPVCRVRAAVTARTTAERGALLNSVWMVSGHSGSL